MCFEHGSDMADPRDMDADDMCGGGTHGEWREDDEPDEEPTV